LIKSPEIDLFWPTFLKTMSFIFGWFKSLAFLELEAHGWSLGPLRWIFKKYSFLHPWRTFDGFSFFPNRRNLHFI
jgi:hypothetical protein